MIRITLFVLILSFIGCSTALKKEEPQTIKIELSDVIPTFREALLERDTSKIKTILVDGISILEIDAGLLSDSNQLKYDFLKYAYYTVAWNQQKIKGSITNIISSNLIKADSCSEFEDFLLDFSNQYHEKINNNETEYTTTLDYLVDYTKDATFIKCSDFIDNGATYNVEITDSRYQEF